MKRIAAILLIIAALFAPCGCKKTDAKYQYAFFDIFDTVTELTIYAENETAAADAARAAHERLIYLNKLFDIYNEYNDAVSLMAVNASAANAPVSVSEETMALLKFAKEAYTFTGGRVNAAMGGVLSIWHDYREAGLADEANAQLPPMELLEKAAEHTDISSIVLDEANGTVFFTDSMVRLDVGAIAKGFAGQIVTDELNARIDAGEISAALISLGGNVCAAGTKPNGEAWQIAVQDPRGSDNAATASIASGYVVTSGDYQRYYTVNGVRYNHIIDPDTLMSADKHASVTVISQDGALADALSTALFIMDSGEGRALIDSIDDAEALWIAKDGGITRTDGFNIAERLRQTKKDIMIVFVSNKENTVFSSYKYNPIWFIPKNQMQFVEPVVDKIINRMKENEESNSLIQIKMGSRVIEVDIRKIKYFKTEGHYINYFCNDGYKSESFRCPKCEVEMQLEGLWFVRTHNRYLVNIRQIHSISNNTVILSNKEEIPISRAQLDIVKDKFQDYLRSIR